MKERLAYTGGIITSLLASACCTGPVVLGLLGITGLGLLPWLAWLRPYLLVLTFASVGISYYYAYSKSFVCTCSQRTRKVNRVFFWVLVSFALFGVFSPYVL